MLYSPERRRCESLSHRPVHYRVMRPGGRREKSQLRRDNNTAQQQHGKHRKDGLLCLSSRVARLVIASLRLNRTMRKKTKTRISGKARRAEYMVTRTRPRIRACLVFAVDIDITKNKVCDGDAQ